MNTHQVSRIAVALALASAACGGRSEGPSPLSASDVAAIKSIEGKVVQTFLAAD